MASYVEECMAGYDAEVRRVRRIVNEGTEGEQTDALKEYGLW